MAASYSRQWTGAQIITCILASAAIVVTAGFNLFTINDNKTERLVRAETRLEAMQRDVDRANRRADAALAVAMAGDPETARKLIEQMKESDNATHP